MGTSAARDRSARARLAGVVLAGALALAACAAVGGSAPALGSGIDRASFDPSVRAQDDFFRAVNGTWLKKTPIPPDKSRIGAFPGMREKTEAQLRALVEEAARTRSDAEAARIGDLYASFVDESMVERAGLGPLAEELAAIDALPSVDALGAAMGRLDRLGVDLPLGYYITLDSRDTTRSVPWLGQSGLLLPDRDYYLVDGDERFARARAACAAYLARLLALSVAAGDAATQADAVVALETALARSQWTRVENRDPLRTYNPMPSAVLASLAPGFDWSGYLAATGLAARTSEIVVRQPTYLPAFAALARATPLRGLEGVPAHPPPACVRALSSPRPTSMRASRSRAPRCAERSRTKRAGSVASRSSSSRRARRSAGSTSRAISRRRRRNGWSGWSPTCSPPIARASTDSTG